MTKRCEGCDEPDFMCCCSKEFVGKQVSEAYHHGTLIDGKELKRQMFSLSIKPTIIINRRAFVLQCPDRHAIWGN